IGFVVYLDVLRPSSWSPFARSVTELTVSGKLLACGVALLAVFTLYRKIGQIGKLTVALWAGMLLTVATVIVTAARRFDPALAFRVPEGAFHCDAAFLFAFGQALAIAMYDFLGYYDICYLGDEVVQPARTIPRAVILSVVVVALLYAVINIGTLGVLSVDGVA